MSVNKKEIERKHHIMEGILGLNIRKPEFRFQFYNFLAVLP